MRNFFAKCDTSSCLVSTAAVGQQFVDSDDGVFYVNKKLKIVTRTQEFQSIWALQISGLAVRRFVQTAFFFFFHAILC